MAAQRMNRKFIAIWLAQMVSTIGSGLSSFGLGVYVFQQTGLASASSMIMLLGFLPGLMLSAPAGVLADRYDRRKLMVWGDGLSGLGILFILVCMIGQAASVWQLGAGVAINSTFSSLMEPAYKATVSDLVPKEQYTRASGMVQLANSARFLISPVLTGLLLSVADVKLLLMIDISTFFITSITVSLVRRGIQTMAPQPDHRPVPAQLRQAWQAVNSDKGMLALLKAGAALTFLIGFLQTLSTPMVLSFATEAQLGLLLTISAGGMLASSLLLSSLPLRGSLVRVLSISMAAAGLFMTLFGILPLWTGMMGFSFFACLPFANTGMDSLIRGRVPRESQGQIWGLAGLLTQLGYVAAYALAGPLNDLLFAPSLMPEGPLAATPGRVYGTGAGRGTALLVSLAGLLLVAAAWMTHPNPALKDLERKAISI